MKQETESQSWFEKRKNRIAFRAIVGLGSFATTMYFGYKGLFPPNDPPFADASIITINETLTDKELLLNPLEEHYPKVEKYDHMSIEEFEAQPLSERLMFADYLAQKTEQQGIYKKFYKNSTSDGYYYKTGVAPVRLEYSDMLDYQAVNNYVHTRQLALLQFNTTQDLDKTNSKKLLSAAFYKTNVYTSSKYDEIKADIDLIEKPGVIKIKYEPIRSTGLLEGDRTIGNQTEHIKYKEVYFYDRSSYRNYYARFILADYTSFDGEQKFAWLLADKSTKPDGYSIE